MMPSAVARRDEMLPGFTLPAIDGSPILLESYRGRANLVVVFAGDDLNEDPVRELLEALAARTEEVAFEAAQVLVAVTSRPVAVPQRGRCAFLVLVDDSAHIHRRAGLIDAAGRPVPAVFVTDRFREIYATYLSKHGSALPRAKEILDWLMFINIQCPECGVPEWLA